MDEQTNQDTTSQEASPGRNDPANANLATSKIALSYQLMQVGIHFLWKYKAIGLFCSGLFFIVGVPLIINELYKHPGYITVWSAADVLSYYGAVLGSAATIVALGATMWFTRQQIRQERFLQTRIEKWKYAESIYDNLIIKLNPLSLMDQIYSIYQTAEKETVTKDILNALCKYEANCMDAPYQISLNVSILWNPDLGVLNSEISDMAMEGIKIVNRERVNMREFQKSSWNDPKNTDSTKKFYLIRDEFIHDITHKSTDSYRRIVNHKEETFKQIYADIEKEADQMLYFWRKH